MVALADAVSEPPAPWTGRVVPVPESDLSGAEPAIRAAVSDARLEVARLLADPGAQPARLAQAYGRLGALLLLREVEAPADAAFRNARVLEPESFRWPYYGGYLAMMTGDTDKALELFEAAGALDPDYPTLHLRLGKLRLDRSELAEAKSELLRVAEVEGLAPAANLYLGQVANLERRHEDAVRHLGLTLSLDPEATEAHWPLAQAYRALRQDAKAREHMALVEPRTPPAKDPLLDQLRGATAQSVPAFERAIYAVDKRDYAAAVAEFAAGLQVAPDNLAARVSYARVRYLNGDGPAAGLELDRVLEAEPDRTLALFLKALLTEGKGDVQGAAALYRRALESDPDHPGVNYCLANLEFREGRWTQAAAGYRRALDNEDAPPPAALLELLALHRAGAADSETALRLAALAERSPQDSALRYAQIRFLALARDQGVRDPAKAVLLALALAYEQPSPQALRTLALAQAAAGDFAAATANQSQAIGISGGWLPRALLAAMEREQTDYKAGRLEAKPWPLDDPLLAPPPLDPSGPFRDYPASQPY